MKNKNENPQRQVIYEDYRRKPDGLGTPDGLGLTDEARYWVKHASAFISKPDAEPEFKAIAQGCEDFLITILKNCPPCADRTTALNRVREARMWANSAIALEEE